MEIQYIDFMLGFEAGLYDEDPGYKVTTTWMKDLRGACDDLIVANEEARDLERTESERLSRALTDVSAPNQPTPRSAIPLARHINSTDRPATTAMASQKDQR
jgi:hypothetical protein